jgi:hypothetical protein
MNEVDGSESEFLNNLTQEGIADAIGAKQSSIFKELHALCIPTLENEEPLIKSLEKVRIPGRERVCSIYFLSHYGLEITKQKLHYFEEKKIEVQGLDDGTEQIITLSELLNKIVKVQVEPTYLCALLRIANTITSEGKIAWLDLTTTEPKEKSKCDFEQKSKLTTKLKVGLELVKNPYFNRIAIKDQEYFFGREHEVRYIISLLQNNQSCSIIGPRRIGKSSLINAISNPEVLKKNGLNPANYIFVFIDLEGLGNLTQSEFFYQIVEELRNRVTEKNIRELLEDVINKENIRFIDLKKIFRYTTKLGKKVIFLFDEFELITNNRNLDFNFYSGLRNLANSYKVGYITASHTPLLELTFSKKTLGSPFFNFFAQIEINLLSERAINELITEPANKHGVVFDDNIIGFIKKRVGLHPFFAQMLCFHIFDHLKENGSFNSADIPKIEQLFMNEAKQHFHYFWNHLTIEEQKYLKNLATNGDKIDNTGKMTIIQNLKKKALILHVNNVVTIFCNSFLDFISRDDIKITEEIQQIENPIEAHLVPIDKDLEDRYESAIDKEIEKKPIIALEYGNNYFVNETEPDRTVTILNELTQHKIPGLIITRTPTKKVEKKWGISNSTIYWLCSQPGSGNLPPIIGKISHTINEFIKQNQTSLIFLDGLEFLINNNDFSKTLHLMDNLKEMVAIHDSIFIIPMSSSMFSEKEMALLSKNFIKIPKGSSLDFSLLSND